MPKVVSDRARKWLLASWSILLHLTACTASGRIEQCLTVLRPSWQIIASLKPPYESHTVAAAMAPNIRSSAHRYSCWKPMAHQNFIHHVRPGDRTWHLQMGATNGLMHRSRKVYAWLYTKHNIVVAEVTLWCQHSRSPKVAAAVKTHGTNTPSFCSN
jgi:hypothetical protein